METTPQSGHPAGGLEFSTDAGRGDQARPAERPQQAFRPSNVGWRSALTERTDLTPAWKVLLLYLRDLYDERYASNQVGPIPFFSESVGKAVGMNPKTVLAHLETAERLGLVKRHYRIGHDGHMHIDLELRDRLAASPRTWPELDTVTLPDVRCDRCGDSGTVAYLTVTTRVVEETETRTEYCCSGCHRTLARRDKQSRKTLAKTTERTFEPISLEEGPAALQGALDQLRGKKLTVVHVRGGEGENKSRSCFNLTAIPEALQQLSRWICWDCTRSGSEWRKVPINPHTGRRADYTQPASFSTLSEAVEAVTLYGLAGIGFVLGDGLIGIDLDTCRDPETGTLTGWAQEILASADSYAEVSPSGTGVKVFARGQLVLGPGLHKVSTGVGGQVEFYSDHRYFTVTGHHLEGTPTDIRERDLRELHARLFADRNREVPPPRRPASAREGTSALPRVTRQVDAADREALARAQRVGREKFQALFRGDWESLGCYRSQSEAELALFGYLATACHCDPVQMKCIALCSGLRRAKWDDHRTYLDQTIERAIQGHHQRRSQGKE